MSVEPAVIPKKKRVKKIKPAAGPHQIIYPDDVVMSHQWHLNGSPITEIPENVVGFVYCITNLKTGKKYIGKKNFFRMKSRSINKQAYKERVQSDFIEYYGSNDQLNVDVVVNGPEHFRRDIIVMCTSISMMSYWETKYIFMMDAIISDRFYNEWVTCKITCKHVTQKNIDGVELLDLRS